MSNFGLPELVIVFTIMAIFVALAYVLIAGLARAFHGGTPTRDPALDALRTRLASGEIDESEYRRLRSVLHGR
jgi:uncharacterized membrane protein